MMGAKFSADRRYRFQLDRWTGFSDRRVMFIMLNPSTADETKDDPTIRRCIRFAHSWGFGLLSVVNLSPLRATDPHALINAGSEPDEIWKRNIDTIVEIAGASELRVAAWGVHGKHCGRDQAALRALEDAGYPLHCLGRSLRTATPNTHCISHLKHNRPYSKEGHDGDLFSRTVQQVG